jgi:hypothetical protein
MGFLTTAALVGVGFLLKHNYDGLLGKKLLLLLAATVGLMIYLVLRRQMVAAAGLLLTLSVLSVSQIHPLYRGLGPITRSPMIEAVKAAPNDGGRWVMVEGEEFTNLAAAAGKPQLSGTYAYPHLDLWRQFDPDPSLENIYNRYAHALFTTQPQSATFALRSQDAFAVRYQPCVEPFVSKIQHIISLKPLTDPCLVPTKTVDNPAIDFYLYDVKP